MQPITFQQEATTMRVLALNSSLRTQGESRTELMLTHLAKGMRDAGAEVDMVNLREKKIGFCWGCFTCMTKTPGRCALQDDMTLELYPKWLAADVCVYATPLFHWTLNAPMKAFIERTWPACEPFFIQCEDGRWVHPLRHPTPAAVILSVAGFAEDWIFDGLSHYAHFLFGRSGRLMAEIYRPGAMLMTQGAAEFLPDILAATEQAGRELVTAHSVSPETLARIRRPLADAAHVARMANLFWQTCIDARVTPKTFEKQGMTPRPSSIQDYLAIMEMGFNPAAAAGVRTTLQFEFSGDVAGSCYLQIADGQLHGHAGSAERADLIVRAPFEVWIDVVTGKTPGMQSFMSGQCRAEGEFSLLMQFDIWFQRQPRPAPAQAAH
jgi:hypothetical protein